MRYAPLKCYGGKTYLLKHILPLIPPHKCYVEVFGGSARLLFAKPPSPVEVYNDIDEDLVNFYRVLRDPKKYKKLKKLLLLTPYARREFEFCRDHLHDPDIDDVERARRLYVVIRQSFSANCKRWGYSINKSRKTFYNIVDCFDVFHERIRKVQIECDDFENIIKRYDTPQTFFYLDPPYLNISPSTIMEIKNYMSAEDHERLVNVLLGIKGKALLSGYENEIYRKLEENGWRKIVIEKICCHTNPRKNLRGKRKYVRECLWMNYDPPQKSQKN